MSFISKLKNKFQDKPNIYIPYEDQKVIVIKWWLHDYAPTDLFWARLRTFSNGKTDVLFENEDKLYGFESEEYAGYFLSADEYMPFNKLDEEDLIDLEIPKGQVKVVFS
mgnify:CR=1 FL=1